MVDKMNSTPQDLSALSYVVVCYAWLSNLLLLCEWRVCASAQKVAGHAILCGGPASPSQCLFSAVSTLSSPSNPDLCISISIVVFHFAQWGTWCGVHCAGICGAELAPRYYIDCYLLFEHTVCSYSIVLSPCVCLIPSPPLPSPPLPPPTPHRHNRVQ